MRWKWWGVCFLLAALAAAASWLTSRFPLESLASQESLLRGALTEHPAISWVLGFLVYFLTSLVPGTRGKAVLVGWLFGFWWGVAMVNGALTLAALVGFSVSRWLLREQVAERYPLQVNWVNRELAARGAEYVIVLRAVPVSFTLTNYLLGATLLPAHTYWWSTQIGLLPGNIVFVNLGTQLPSLVEWQARGWSAFVSWELLGSFLILTLFTLGVPVAARFFGRGRARPMEGR